MNNPYHYVVEDSTKGCFVSSFDAPIVNLHTKDVIKHLKENNTDVNPEHIYKVLVYDNAIFRNCFYFDGADVLGRHYESNYSTIDEDEYECD